jgi:alpha-L-fucosidase 2
MRMVVRSFLLVLGLFLTLSLRADPGPLSLWFTNPAVPPDPNSNPDADVSWYTQTLPVGNGKLAAMVYGGVDTENIQFNEDTIWCGQVHDYTNTNRDPANLKAIQTNCFNRTNILGAAQSNLMSMPYRLPTYMAPGGLWLTFAHSNWTDYSRSLDLNTATVNVRYSTNGVTFDRDIFASAPSNRVIVLHFTSAAADKIAFTCGFFTKNANTVVKIGNDLVMDAHVSIWGDDRYFDGSSHSPVLTNAVRYEARVRVITTNGTVNVTSNSISVADANDATLLLSVVSNVKNYTDLNADYAAICSSNIANAAALGYEGLRRAQQADYTNLFNRVVLDLGVDTNKTGWGIGYRKKQMAADGNDPNLVTLVFQMGRYLTIAGSRRGSEALNLQGKWNNLTNLYAYWGSKMTLNINEEMNYWGTEMANLSECTEPLFDLIRDLSVTGGSVARSNYFCTKADPALTNAWVAHHNTDLWRNAGAVNTTDGIWPTGGAWLCQHLWWHYQYTGDTNWLSDTAYPLMKGAAQFFAGFLSPHKWTNSNMLVTCPSYSPEHNWKSGSTEVANVPGPTMDNALIRDLFNHVIEANQVLTNVLGANYDYTLRTNWVALRDRLPPYQVGQYGQLQEWLEDIDANPDGHRHCSHLVGLSPGEDISPFYPRPITNLAASRASVDALAARISVDFRGDATGDTPWCRVVRMNLHDRLMDGDHAFLNFTNVLADSKTSTNLVFGDGSYGKNRQLDWIYGMVAGIGEMFLQSQSGEVFLLPALPTQLTNGRVSGLCARGGFEVDQMTWTNGKLVSATILSRLGNPCRLRTKCPVDIRLGSNYVDAPMVLPGLYRFSTVAGSNYTVTAAQVAETENLSVSFSSGDTHQIVTNAAFSNWRGTLLTASATNDFVTYVVSNLTAGAYHLFVGADASADRGAFQLAVGPNGGGATTNVGLAQDTYSATNVVYLLPIKLNTPTNLIVLWTNLLKEFDCGTWTAPADGHYRFKFMVASNNASSSGYSLAFDYIKFTPANSQPATSNAAPGAPVNVSPANGAANQPPGLALQASAFSDPDGGDTHAASEWLVWQGDTPVFDSGTDSVNKTNRALSAGALNYGTAYNWQVRYQDNHGSWSGYSTPTAFSTAVPTLEASGADGKLVFTWPTNTAGFFLEGTTNLLSTNWIPATPPPVMAGGSCVVTNAVTAENMFYRLHKP